MLEVVPVDEGAIFEHLHAGLEGAVELGPPDLVVVEGDGGVLGVARHVDNLALVQQPGRQQTKWEVGLDDSPALGLELILTKCNLTRHYRSTHPSPMCRDTFTISNNI